MAPKSKGKKVIETKDLGKGASKDDSTEIKSSVPNWPVFSYLLPEEDLVLRSLVPNQIVTISNFWPAKLCKDYVTFLSSLPLITTPGKPKKGDAVRVNDRFQVNDAVFANKLWSETALKGLITKSHDSHGLWGGEVV
jgi:hypothetical protein